MKEEIIKELSEKINISNDKFLVGISGGKDSMVSARLLTEIVGPDKVMGVMLTNKTQYDIEDSYEICNLLGVEYTEIDIGYIYDEFIESLQYTSRLNCLYTNRNRQIVINNDSAISMLPKIRETCLLGLSKSLNYIPIIAINKSKRYLTYDLPINYYSINNPVSSLFNHEVIKLGNELNLPEKILNKISNSGNSALSYEQKYNITYDELYDSILNLSTIDLWEKLKTLNK